MHGVGDDSDIVIARSNDYGMTWNRSTITSGPGNSWQLFPTANIDQFGNIVVGYYDNRSGNTNAGGNFLMDFIVRYSTDGGVNWSPEFTVNDMQFDPDATPLVFFGNPPGPTTRIGEYFGIDLFGGTAHLVINGNVAGDNMQLVYDNFAIGGQLIVDGDDNGPTNDDIVVRRMAADNDFLEVLVNGQRQYAGLLEGLTQLVVNGLDGNDTLTVDSSNGLLTFPDGIHFDGGAGFDSVNAEQSGGSAAGVAETVIIGAQPGDGQHILTTASATQTVQFENVEPLTTNVPAATFSISSAPGIASLLQDDNQINYENAQILATAGRVTVDNFEPIEFDNKTNLIIDAGAGSDSINLNNPNTPTGLTSITVNGDDPTAGSDTVVVNGTTGNDSVTIDQILIDGARITARSR